ncbi:MAG: YdcF family protein [Nitrospirota bacterium]
MFILKKILTPFLLPPGIFIVILIFSGLLFLFKRHWKVSIVNCLIGIFMWFLSISPVSDIILRGLESDFRIPENPQGDVIVLLGGGSHSGSQDLSGIGSPADDMLGRIVTAVRLQKRLNVPIIVSSGQVFKHKPSEVLIVRRFLVNLGVPLKKIILEDKSRDTIENARYTKAICEKLGFKKPILVTSAYHMSRSVLSFKKVDMDVTPLPAGLKTWKDKKYGWEDYLPDASGFKNTCIAVREYMGLLFYRFAY